MAAKKPASGLPKSSTAVVPMPDAGYHYVEQPGYTYTNTIVSSAVTNEPFDARLFPALPHAGPVSRGLIMEYSPAGPYRLRFMYNPNEIAYGFELSGSLIPMDQTAAVPTAGAIGGHSITFELAFDRHYEVAYRQDKLGVFRDITVLKGLVGIKDETQQGFMVQKVLKFIFGPNYVFYGYINTMSVNIAYFSEKMIPMRAIVQATATFVPPIKDGKWYDPSNKDNKSAADVAADAATNTKLFGDPTTPTAADIKADGDAHAGGF